MFYIDVRPEYYDHDFPSTSLNSYTTPFKNFILHYAGENCFETINHRDECLAKHNAVYLPKSDTKRHSGSLAFETEKDMLMFLLRFG